MKLEKGIEVLEILNTLGSRDTIYPTLLYDKDDVVLVDTGIPGSFTIVRDQMLSLSIPLEKLTKIIITHQDFDHIGGLSTLVDNQKNIDILAHELEEEYINGTKKPIKLTEDVLVKIRSMIKLHSYKKQEELTKILDNYHRNVTKVLKDNDELNICGGIKVIHTPGHTQGHICLYLKKYKTLIAGDALTVSGGELFGPDNHQTLDLRMAIESLNKLTDYNIKTVICYHGGVYNKNVNKRILEIIKDETRELNTKEEMKK